MFGGGIAGCATALALQRRGLRTVILERSAGEAERIGEHLAPDARPWLARLGLWEAFLADRHLRSPGVRASWGDASIHEREYILDPYGDGWNLDRRRFDAMLTAAALASGGTILRDVRTVTVSAVDEGWSVESIVAGRRRVFTSAFLVDATGRAAAAARRLGARQRVCDQLVGIMGWMQPAAGANVSDATLLIEAAADGWWYATLLPDRRLMVAFMTDPPLSARRAGNLAALWSNEMERTRHIRERAAGFAFDGDVCARFAGTCACEPVAGDRWIAVGDAASAFDPLSSRGISKALGSAIAAANVIERALSGAPEGLEEYAADIAREFEEYLVARSRHYGRETRWPDREFWRSRRDPPRRSPPRTEPDRASAEAGTEAQGAWRQ